jgi:large subunit ribosomal protein L4
MSTVKLYDNKFNAKGETNVEFDFNPEKISVPAVHQVVKALLANRRQGNASTKDRSEVSGGGAKPHKQKGTGRARQGSSRSGIQVGGGTVFGPKPRSYQQKINKKMMKKAIASVLIDKFNENCLFVVDQFGDNASTKELHKTLTEKDMFPVLFVSSEENSPINQAAKNLQFGRSLPVKGFSVYEAVKFKNLVIDQAAFNQLLERLS